MRVSEGTAMITLQEVGPVLANLAHDGRGVKLWYSETLEHWFCTLIFSGDEQTGSGETVEEALTDALVRHGLPADEVWRWAKRSREQP
jgi:hypothetical protein